MKPVLNFDSDFRVLFKSVSVKANYHTRKITNSKTDNIKAVHSDKKQVIALH